MKLIPEKVTPKQKVLVLVSLVILAAAGCFIYYALQEPAQPVNAPATPGGPSVTEPPPDTSSVGPRRRGPGAR